MAFQLNYLARNGLLEDIYVAESAKIAVPPSVDHSVSRHGPRVVISCLDPQRHLSIFMGLKWTRVELVRNLDILGAGCRGGSPAASTVRISFIRTLIVEQVRV